LQDDLAALEVNLADFLRLLSGIVQMFNGDVKIGRSRIEAQIILVLRIADSRLALVERANEAMLYAFGSRLPAREDWISLLARNTLGEGNRPVRSVTGPPPRGCRLRPATSFWMGAMTMGFGNSRRHRGVAVHLAIDFHCKAQSSMLFCQHAVDTSRGIL